MIRNLVFYADRVLIGKKKDQPPFEKKDARDWLYRLKAAGYALYVLFKDQQEEVSFLDLVDGSFVMDGEESLSAKAFSSLEEKFGFEGSTCLFVDACMDHVKMAKHCGWHALYFENRTLAEKKMAGMGINALEVNEQTDIFFMKEALKQARKAAHIGEVPIGCVIVRKDQIIARGYNQRNKKHSTLGHAEISAIGKASKVLQDWRLEDCTMYVTLEPCSMCAGAMIQARLGRLVLGTMNRKAGCAGSVMNMLSMEGFNHQVPVTYHVLEDVCGQILTDFFRELREKSTKP